MGLGGQVRGEKGLEVPLHPYSSSRAVMPAGRQRVGAGVLIAAASKPALPADGAGPARQG